MADRRQYMKDYYQRTRKDQLRRRKERYDQNKTAQSLSNRQYKAKVINEAKQLLGNRCQLCGSRERLEFCHVVYRKKMKVNNVFRNAQDALKSPDDFLLLCEDCHQHPERHLKAYIEMRAIEHGQSVIEQRCST